MKDESIFSLSRRNFFKASFLSSLSFITKSYATTISKPIKDKDKLSIVYYAKSQETNRLVDILFEKLGGIQRIIDNNDIVLIKPNSQWWNQGATNTDILYSFIRKVLSLKNFKGEIVIADNHQTKNPNSRGWTTTQRSGTFNLNELVHYFNENGYANVTKYHWHDAGPNPAPLQGDASGNIVVKHPSEGDGYVWPRDLYYEDPFGHRTILSYPIFTSTYSGVTIDLKNGAFYKGKYTNQPVKFINFPSLNHHGEYAGMTGAVKNLMGVVDMSCGWPAPFPEGYYNVHHIGATKLFQILSRLPLKDKIPKIKKVLKSPSIFRFHYTGGVLGKFMSQVRKPDLNIMTAIRVGWGSRTDVKKAVKKDTIVASTDPLALDYWSAKNILLPVTKEANAPNKFMLLNNPDRKDGPLYRFLSEANKEFEGSIKEENIKAVL